jgi:hypothetical protein
MLKRKDQNFLPHSSLNQTLFGAGANREQDDSGDKMEPYLFICGGFCGVTGMKRCAWRLCTQGWGAAGRWRLEHSKSTQQWERKACRHPGPGERPAEGQQNTTERPQWENALKDLLIHRTGLGVQAFFSVPATALKEFYSPGSFSPQVSHWEKIEKKLTIKLKVLNK